ncbi:MAG: M6 family metalloprotease domain-containing protein [Candidatus Zixiibacteriota bacterium]|nr:MAG: M6 family metalloprotease domain-containing protein [candidate division Zixibacteria bacterium]
MFGAYIPRATRICRITVGIAVLSMTAAVNASPPHPSLVEGVAAGKRTTPYFMNHARQLRESGVNAGYNPFELPPSAKITAPATATIAGDFRMLAVLVHFTDKSSSTPASYFDNLLYGTSGVTLRDYYASASYGQLDIVTVNLPSSTGWSTAPQTYAYYVNDESGINPESYPNNARKLVEDLVAIVDGQVNFSNYDNDGNGYVDVLTVIHAGQGAERTGSNADMWSHMWTIYPKMTNDGVYVSTYTMQPEYIDAPGDMTIGVYAHELGHAFGLPDLYDTDFTSNGIGRWGVMGYGSWLGPHSRGEVPAYPCGWSRIELGFNTPTVPTQNINGQAIQDVKVGEEIFRLWTAGVAGAEYFLVENRQKTDYDTYLPDGGLLVWHIDETRTSNDYEWYPGLDAAQHYLVALEQADGLFGMEHCSDLGDAPDVFSGTGANSFDAMSATNSDAYTSGPTAVAIANISEAAATMYADFRVSLTGGVGEDTDDPGDGDVDILPASVQLSQNYPNPFNPSTTISFYLRDRGTARIDIFNLMGQRIKTLLNETVEAGMTQTNWDGTDYNDRTVASGIYIYRLQAGDQQQAKKMILLR